VAFSPAVLLRIPGGFILEVGTYVGYSSQKMAIAVPDAHIVCMEVDPVHVVIAKTVIDFGGLLDRIDVWTGHSKDLCGRIAGRYGGPYRCRFSAAFFDQKGSRYDEDLQALEWMELMTPGALLIADNVLKPGAPVFLWKVCQGENEYKSQILSMQEFAMPVEDWMSVSIKTHKAELAADERWEESREAERKRKEVDYKEFTRQDLRFTPMPKYKIPENVRAGEIPVDVMNMHRECDRIRDKATGTNLKGRGHSVSFEEWKTFSEDIKNRLAVVGITVTATVELPGGPRRRG